MVLKWNLTQNALVLRVDEAVGMAAVAVHVAHIGRQAAIGHEDRHLMQRSPGDSDQKSHIAVGERRLVLGCRFWVWMKSGNL